MEAALKEKFSEKLSRVSGNIRTVEMNNPHNRFGCGLLYWSNKAESLHDAALILGCEHNRLHFDAFALLAGFSLEVLIKGIIVGLDEKVPHIHDLIRLSEAAGFKSSDDEKAVLRACTIYTTWYSRYPIASKVSKTLEGLGILEKEYPSSGTLKEVLNKEYASRRIVSVNNYQSLYDFYNQRFFDVYRATIESAI